MLVIDALSVIRDNINVDIIDEKTEKILSQYNGKDSIDEIYNNQSVSSMVYGNGRLSIYI